MPKDKSDLIAVLALQALSITKLKKLRDFIGYFDGVLRKLIGKSLFSNAFKDYRNAIELCTYTY